MDILYILNIYWMYRWGSSLGKFLLLFDFCFPDTKTMYSNILSWLLFTVLFLCETLAVKIILASLTVRVFWHNKMILNRVSNQSISEKWAKLISGKVEGSKYLRKICHMTKFLFLSVVENTPSMYHKVLLEQVLINYVP